MARRIPDQYSERTGDLEAFRGLPKNKIISLGILNTRDPRIETPDDVRYRVEGAAKFIPLEDLSICLNCGFPGAAIETRVTEDIEKRKFGLLVETAEKIWG